MVGADRMVKTDDIVFVDLEFLAFRPELCHGAWQQTISHFLSQWRLGQGSDDKCLFG